jgi:trehalose 6-phosphate synthase
VTARRILVASNRGPVRFVEEGGDLVPKRGSGGLVTALAPAVQETGGLWVAAAMGEGDRSRAEQSPDGRMELVVEDAKHRLRLLSFDPEKYDHAYNVVSNRLLWFAHHYLWDLPRAPSLDADTPVAWRDYRDVNRAFAEALAEEAGESPADVLVQDYHLSLVPSQLRLLAPGARIAHFHHCPFAGPTYLRLLPEWMRRELLEGLLGADLLGFQHDRWAANFLASCSLVEGAEVSGDHEILWQGRSVRVGVYPISIDAAFLREQAAEAAVRRRRRALERWRGERRMLLRVDRAELSKNVLRGFEAFGDLLLRYPRWRGRVVFLALLNPSRPEIPEYRTYTEECLALAERINARFRQRGWSPIELRVSDDYEEALAAYALYDALVVNPVFDGMNLVAKEGPVLNRRDGVLILSRNAGAYAELGRHALGIDPIDVAGTADAMAVALEMPGPERAERARALRRAAARFTPGEWAGRQLADLEQAARAG